MHHIVYALLKDTDQAAQISDSLLQCGFCDKEVHALTIHDVADEHAPDHDKLSNSAIHEAYESWQTSTVPPRPSVGVMIDRDRLVAFSTHLARQGLPEYAIRRYISHLRSGGVVMRTHTDNGFELDLITDIYRSQFATHINIGHVQDRVIALEISSGHDMAIGA